MTRHKILLGGALIAALLTTAGCAPGGQDFWGNPVPSSGRTHPADQTEACQAPTVGDTFTHPKGGDPDAWQVHDSTFAPGFPWVRIGVSVVAIERGLDGIGNRLCLPVDVHIEAIALDDGTEILGEQPGQRVVVEEFNTSTPLENHWVSFQYDPNDPAFTEYPPGYKVTVQAFYNEDLDQFHKSSQHSIGCIIKFEGASVAHNVMALSEYNGVYCEFESNRYRKA